MTKNELIENALKMYKKAKIVLTDEEKKNKYKGAAKKFISQILTDLEGE